MNNKPDYDLLYAIAEGQSGYFTAGQALKAGYSRERLSDLTARGRFQRVGHGVYRLTHFPGSPYEDLFIAWLRVGPNAVISHDSALGVYDLSDVMPAEIHVIMPRTGSRRREGLRLHTNKLHDDEITHRQGLPVTNVVRTITDVINFGISHELVEQAILEALQRGLTTREEFYKQARRSRGRAADIIEQVLKQTS